MALFYFNPHRNKVLVCGENYAYSGQNCLHVVSQLGRPTSGTSQSDSVVVIPPAVIPTCRPYLPRMKSCIKPPPSRSGAITPVYTDADTSSVSLSKKHVAFSEKGTEQVFEADEWDRTPAEVAMRLSYE